MMALSCPVLSIWKLKSISNCARCRCVMLYKPKRTISSTKNMCNTDDPIKYSGTQASKMTTADTLKLKPNPAVLPIEKYILAGTAIVLFIYSFIRKENKIDRILDGSFDYEGEDEIKILNALLHARLQGIKTDELEEKLRIIRQRKK